MNEAKYLAIIDATWVPATLDATWVPATYQHWFVFWPECHSINAAFCPNASSNFLDNSQDFIWYLHINSLCPIFSPQHWCICHISGGSSIGHRLTNRVESRYPQSTSIKNLASILYIPNTNPLLLSARRLHSVNQQLPSWLICCWHQIAAINNDVSSINSGLWWSFQSFLCIKYSEVVCQCLFLLTLWACAACPWQQ